MSSSGNPLLDQYNQDGVVTPGLKRALDIFKQNNTPQIAPLSGSPAAPGGQPPAPAAPQPQQGLVPMPGQAPTPRMPLSSAPAPSPHQSELQRLTQPPIQGGPLAHTKADTGRSGLDQIQNPWLRNTLHVLDAIGSGFAPGLTAAIPGTSLHHQMLVRGAQGNVNEDEKVATDQATRQHSAAETTELGARENEENARATSLANPQPKQEEGGKTITTDQGIMQYDPATQRYDIKAGGAPDKKEAGGTVHQLEDGSLIYAKPDGTATAVTMNGQPVKGKTAQPKESLEEKAVREDQAAHPGESTTDALKHVKTATQPPERTDHGQNFIDPKTGKLVRVEPGQQAPEGAMTATGYGGTNTPTTAARNAAERSDTMLDLDKRIRTALQNPEISKGTGPLAGRLSEAENRLGTLPHDLSEMKNDLKSYGAFQAGLHPVRGIGGLEYFDKVMGGLGQTPEELLGKLDSNKATAESVERVGHHGSSGGSANTPNVRKYNPSTGKLE